MKAKQLRNRVFSLHRYLGLAVGLVLVLVGLTGSLLVFHNEIDRVMINMQIEKIVTPTNPTPLAMDDLVTKVQNSSTNVLDFKINYITLPEKTDDPYRIFFSSKDSQWSEAIVNPYTGEVLKTRNWNNSLFGIIYQIHYQLLGGQIGQILVGIVGFFVVILSITGIFLWPGWRRLISGFKIKWNAHQKRVNFDIHKLVGIIAAVFLIFTNFTGFLWNFYDISEKIIYALTFTPKLPDPVSQVVAGQSSLKISQIIAKSDEALPGAVTTNISLPESPSGVFRVTKKFPGQQKTDARSFVYLDQYTGKTLQLKDSRQPSRAEFILDSFTPLHYGTFGGIFTRILYVFVGLSPTILLVTGFVMWRLRYKTKDINKTRQHQTMS